VNINILEVLITGYFVHRELMRNLRLLMNMRQGRQFLTNRSYPSWKELLVSDMVWVTLYYLRHVKLFAGVRLRGKDIGSPLGGKSK